MNNRGYRVYQRRHGNFIETMDGVLSGLDSTESETFAASVVEVLLQRCYNPAPLKLRMGGGGSEAHTRTFGKSSGMALVFQRWRPLS